MNKEPASPPSSPVLFYPSHNKRPRKAVSLTDEQSQKLLECLNFMQLQKLGGQDAAKIGIKPKGHK